MAFYDTADALYGIGLYGSARYGSVAPDVQVTGVSATANTRNIHLNVFEVDVTEPIYNAPSVTGSVGSLTLNTTAGLSGVSSANLVGGPTTHITEDLVGVDASGLVSSVSVNVQKRVTGFVGTFTLNAEGLSVRSVNTVEVLGVVANAAIGTPEPQTLEALQSAEAVGSVGTVKPNVTTGTLTGVVTTGSIGSLEHSNTVTLTTATGLGQVGQVGVYIQIIISTGVEATGSVGTTVTNLVEKSEAATGVGQIGSPATTAVVFNFEAVKTLHSKRRTVIISRAA